MSKIILIVLDSLGVGEAADAEAYGDSGANTLGNLAGWLGGLELPHMERLGLGYLGDFAGIGRPSEPAGSFMTLDPRSPGKDTTSGHWELADLILEQPFPTYPEGFPPSLVAEFEKRIGSRTLGNYPASGIEIINRLGEEHLRTGAPIVYTSADSVFQVATHEDLFPLERLYEICENARDLLQAPHNVSRVIARPFKGKAGDFYRTPARRDFSVAPPRPTLLDRLCSAGITVTGVGKISDIFGGRGISRSVHTDSNLEGIDRTISLIEEESAGLIFTNLVEFDMLYGHRRDPQGYAGALKQFDRRLPDIMGAMKDSHLLMITGDHGCDPTFKGSDHTREKVPLLMHSRNFSREKTGIRGFSEVSRIISELLLR
ncbi:MAG: phosphopentomutase [bacterium]